MIETLARLQAQRAAAVDRMASRHGGDPAHALGLGVHVRG
jgi:hypothetical protein